jgi:hypothetical protein
MPIIVNLFCTYLQIFSSTLLLKSVRRCIYTYPKELPLEFKFEKILRIGYIL